MVDQTRFINNYIANLAEKIKTTTLDNIMLSTQLTLANEKIAELVKQLESANVSGETETLHQSDYN